MTLIDQRILIPAPMSAAWQVMADHQALPRWRVDCRAVSLLTTHTAGNGVRRRITPPRGKDFIEEFKAWYNGFGYEYSVTDSRQFRYNLHRVRLQATPEGTIVQWTIEFEVRGFLARFFGNRRRRAQLDKMMVASLRELRRYVVSLGVPLDDGYRVKAGVQAAPDVDQRAAYGAQLFKDVEQRKANDQSSPIPEPPVQVEDTPSVPRVAPPSFVVENFDIKPETSVVIEEPPVKVSDTKPSMPISVNLDDKPSKTAVPANSPAPDQTAVGAEKTPLASASGPEATAESANKTQQPDDGPAPDQTVVSAEKTPLSPSAAETKISPDTTSEAETTPPVVDTDAAETSQPAKDSDAATTRISGVVGRMKPPPTTSKAMVPPSPTSGSVADPRATDSMSIWEVFGMDRPADIGEPIPAPADDTASAAETREAVSNTGPTLDEILAMEEPPLPNSASTTISTIVRLDKRSQHWPRLRKDQRRRRLRVRLPRRKR